MAAHLTVPGDIDPSSLGDLVNDCRELVGAVASLGVATAGTVGSVARIARLPLARRGSPTPAAPVDISSQTAGSLDGYADYGS